MIPVFISEDEHNEYIAYIQENKKKFKIAVEEQSIDEMFPFYSQNAKGVIIYKLGKTLVNWLSDWRLILKHDVVDV